MSAAQSEIPGTAKVPEGAQKMMEKMTGVDLSTMSAVQKIIHHLKKREWGEMAGAFMELFTEWFGLDEEEAKEEATKKRQELREETAEAQTQGQLAALQEEVGPDPVAPAAAATTATKAKKVEYTKKHIEVHSASHILFVGDSILKGVRTKYAKGEKPGFIGEVGFASSATVQRFKHAKMMLEGRREEVRGEITGFAERRLRNKLKRKMKKDGTYSKEALDARVEAELPAAIEKTLDQIEWQAKSIAGKTEARIYTGGNNITYDSPEKIVSDMKTMVRMCREMGIKKFVICTRFPPDPRLAQKWDPTKLARRMERGRRLRQLVMDTNFGSGVKKVDLYDKFVASNDTEGKPGFLKDQYATGGDPIHPYAAYREAISHMDAVA